MQNKSRLLTKSIFTVGILSIVLSSLLHISDIFYWSAGVISIIYLIGGWYLFRGYYSEGNNSFLFILGYIYSGFFMGSALAAPQLSSAASLLRQSLLWSIVLSIVIGIFLLRNKESFKKGMKHFAWEAFQMVIIAIVQKAAFRHYGI